MKERAAVFSSSSIGAWLRGPSARAVLALGLVLALGVVFPAEGAFYRSGTHVGALRQMSIHGILAVGLLPVILTGGIDLAVGSMLGLVAVVVAKLVMHAGLSGFVGVVAGIVVGAACGATSGALVSFARLQPFVATLAMMVFARGLAKTVSGGMKVATAVAGPDGVMRYVEVPQLFRVLDTQLAGGGLAVVTIVFAVMAAIIAVLCGFHRLGRYWLAVGGNEEAARLSGVPVAAAKIAAYVWCGICAAMAGICHAAAEQQGDPEAGTTYELTAIAMVVMGGTSLSGGRGGVGLTLLGVLTVGYLDKILSINAVPEASRLMLTGFIIVLAVLAQKPVRS